MKNEKKSFFTGIIFGMALLFFINSIVTNGSLIYRKLISKELTQKQKIAEIQKIVDTYYVNEYDKGFMEETMYKGMVASLKDPYSYYMTEEEFKQFKENTEGNYVGIGITVNLTEDENMLINQVFEGSPAKESGLKEGDKITKVDGVLVNLENYQDVVSSIKGEEGTSVKLTVYRESENKTFDTEVTRKSIDVPTVEHKMLEDNIGYISISQFDRVTSSQFKEAFNSLNSANGLIIDLRNNPGGLLTSVEKIADEIIPEGNVVYTIDKEGNRKDFNADPNYIDIPMVMLVNGNSASASEILAGAFQDRGRGKLVGTQTFGKGLVQNLYKIPDGSAVKITIEKYYTPKGVCIQGIGITPDYIVENESDLASVQLIPHSEDTQLIEAVRVLESEM